MAHSLPDQFGAPPRKCLANGVGPDPKALEAIRADEKRHWGRLVARAFDIARYTKQQVAHALGYQDQSSISRWFTGVERPPIERLIAELPGFDRALMIALAEESHDPAIQVQTTVTIGARRSA